MLAANGPSPRVWGIQELGSLRRRLERSIPTCVGNTSASRALPRSHTVHPHVCGEYLKDRDPEELIYGPSPRVWGIQGF